MSNDLVIFNIRCEKSLFELRIKTPINISGFIETLKNKLELEDVHELVILCPTSEGKMMELKTDDDIEFLKKTKLCFNAVTKDIYCSVELVVIKIFQEELDDNQVQIKMLTNKVEQLVSQFDILSLSLNNKMEENTLAILESLKSIVSNSPQNEICSSPKDNILGDQSSQNETKSGARQKKTKKDKEKEKLPSASTTPLYNENSSENLIQPNSVVTKDIDTLLGMLVNEGFNNTIQNIIVLKRFENDFEKAITYLKST